MHLFRLFLNWNARAVAAAVGAALAFLAMPAAAEVHRFTATVNYAGTTATDVPVALRISEALVAGFDYAAAGDGTHFEIADENGTILPYEIDTWNPGGESLLWVKVPVFQNGRRLTVTYGETEADMTARAAEVWSNYVGVWHMNAVNALGKFPNAAGDARFDAEVSSFSRTGEAGRFGQSVLVYTNAAHLSSSVEKESCSKSSLSGESIEPETSTRNTRFDPLLAALLSGAAAKPMTRSCVSLFHGQTALCACMLNRSPPVGAA